MQQKEQLFIIKSKHLILSLHMLWYVWFFSASESAFSCGVMGEKNLILIIWWQNAKTLVEKLKNLIIPMFFYLDAEDLIQRGLHSGTNFLLFAWLLVSYIPYVCMCPCIKCLSMGERCYWTGFLYNYDESRVLIYGVI